MKDHVNCLPYFFQKTGFDLTCKLSPLETICMQAQILFSGENSVKLSSADFVQREMTVKNTNLH